MGFDTDGRSPLVPGREVLYIRRVWECGSPQWKNESSLHPS